MLCVRCGADNFSGEAVCNKCGAALPKIPGGLSLPMQKTGHLEKLERACSAFQDRVITSDEFIQILSAIHSKVEESVNNLRNMKPAFLSDPDLQTLLDEEYTKALKGSEMMLEAVAEICAYIEHTDEESYYTRRADHAPESHLQIGLSMARAATELLNRSIELGEEVKMSLGVSDTIESIG